MSQIRRLFLYLFLFLYQQNTTSTETSDLAVSCGPSNKHTNPNAVGKSKSKSLILQPNMRAQGPNAQCMDYHDLSTMLNSPWGYPRYSDYFFYHDLKQTIWLQLSLTLIGSRAGTRIWDIRVCSRLLCHLSYHPLTLLAGFLDLRLSTHKL